MFRCEMCEMYLFTLATKQNYEKKLLSGHSEGFGHNPSDKAGIKRESFSSS